MAGSGTGSGSPALGSPREPSVTPSEPAAAEPAAPRLTPGAVMDVVHGRRDQDEPLALARIGRGGDGLQRDPIRIAFVDEVQHPLHDSVAVRS